MLSCLKSTKASTTTALSSNDVVSCDPPDPEVIDPGLSQSFDLDAGDGAYIYVNTKITSSTSAATLDHLEFYVGNSVIVSTMNHVGTAAQDLNGRILFIAPATANYTAYVSAYCDHDSSTHTYLAGSTNTRIVRGDNACGLCHGWDGIHAVCQVGYKQ